MQPRLVLGLTSGMLVALAVALVISVGATPAHAAMHTWLVTMDEQQALPGPCNPNPAPPNSGGLAYVTYDDVTKQMNYTVTYSNLSGAVTSAHFHGPAARGVNAGILISIPVLTSGYSGSAMLTMTQETQLLAGQWYINYHTNACPNGEIRGQIDTAVGGSSRLPGVDGSTASPLAQHSASSDSAWLIAALATGLLAILSGTAVYAWRRSLR